jgi:hypothetical protein
VAAIPQAAVPNVRALALAPSYQDSDLPGIAAALTGGRSAVSPLRALP